MKGKTTPAPAVEPRQYTAEQFAQEYQELCKRAGWQIGAAPQWRQSQDTGDYRLIIVTGVVPMPKESDAR